MSNFSSLKAAIQQYIKTNGNEEITGEILQDILLSMVSVLGDTAINDLEIELQAEVTNRTNEDTELRQSISSFETALSNEATARSTADIELNGRIDNVITAVNSVETKLSEGYIYVGIATPTTDPGTPSGKVFYLATDSGTYTYFGDLSVQHGITLLKYNGSVWSVEALYLVDDEPTPNSPNLVKSGGVAKISGFMVESEEFLKVLQDASGGVLEDINNEGVHEFRNKLNLNNAAQVSYIISPEWLIVITDADGRVVSGIKKDRTMFLYKEEDESEEIKDFLFPENIFGVWNQMGYDRDVMGATQTREYLNTIYPDRMYFGVKALFDGVASSMVLCNNHRADVGAAQLVDIQENSISLKGNGVKELTGNVNLVMTKNTAAVDKDICLMCVGDSLLAGNGYYFDKTGRWSYPAIIEEMFRMDDIDGVQDGGLPENSIRCHLIGTRKGYTRVVTYRGVEINHEDDCHEGRGGWAASDYLRHPLDMPASGGSFDILGLRTVLGNVSDDQMYRAIADTCWGVYPPDITENSWNQYRSYINCSDVAWQDATQAQKNALATWAADEITAHPLNPFYDKNAYDAQKNTMFSWSTYYSRYKTVENDGVTPLSTKGTDYIDGTKVCVPNFVLINLGANDTKYRTGEAYIANEMKLLAELFREATGAKVLYNAVAWPASQIPEYHPNIGQQLDYTTKMNILALHAQNKKAVDVFGNFETQVNRGIFYCPGFFVTSFDTRAAHRCDSFSPEHEFDYTWNKSDIHFGLFSSKAVGYQAYSMIMYLLTF